MKATLALAVLFATAITNAQQVFGDETRAWMVGPAKAVSSGMITGFNYSESGNKIIYTRTEPASIFQPDPTKPPKLDWFVYDTIRGTNTAIKVNGLSERVNYLLLGDERTVFFLDGLNNKLQGFYDLESGAITQTAISFDKIVYYGNKSAGSFFLVSTSEDTLSLVAPGRRATSFKVPKGLRVMDPFESTATTVKFQAPTHENGSMQLNELTLSLVTGQVQLRPLTADEWSKKVILPTPAAFELIGDEVFSMLGLPSLPQPKGTQNTNSKPKKGYLDRKVPVCPTKFGAALEPNGRSVAYVDNGALLFREIRPFDHELAEKMKLEALKAEALSKAKQIGLALFMCASDSKDAFPNGESLVSRLLPYVKDRRILENFNYTFAGGAMTGIQNPATTELGFTTGPGGRAVVYADGHAQWIQDKL